MRSLRLPSHALQGFLVTQTQNDAKPCFIIECLSLLQVGPKGIGIRGLFRTQTSFRASLVQVWNAIPVMLASLILPSTHHKPAVAHALKSSNNSLLSETAQLRSLCCRQQKIRRVPRDVLTGGVSVECCSDHLLGLEFTFPSHNDNHVDCIRVGEQIQLHQQCPHLLLPSNGNELRKLGDLSTRGYSEQLQRITKKREEMSVER